MYIYRLARLPFTILNFVCFCCRYKEYIQIHDRVMVNLDDVHNVDTNLV